MTQRRLRCFTALLKLIACAKKVWYGLPESLQVHRIQRNRGADKIQEPESSLYLDVHSGNQA